MKKLLTPLAALLAIALLAMPSVASAINYGGVGGRPAYPNSANPRTQSIFIYQLKPGQGASDGLRILNNTKQSQTIAVDAVDSELASGGAFTCKQAVEAKQDVGAWIRLGSSTVTVAPNSDQIVPFTISVPAGKNIGVGEHDGCITIQAASQTASKSKQPGIVLSFRSAIRVVVTVPGKIVKKLSIVSVNVSPDKNDKYKVTPVVSNDGNVSLDTKLQPKLLSVFGTEVSSGKEGTSPVLPHSKASLNFELKRPFWGGLYRAQVVASYNANPTTELGVNNDSNRTATAMDSVVFVAAPKPLAALIELIILAAIVFAVYRLIDSRKHAKHVKSHWESYTAKKSDTLDKLAAERGVPWKRIAKVNKLKPPYALSKGQKLRLPAKKPAKKKG
jgi:LysM domain-containing protein/WxL interacting protein linking bacterial and host surfaces